MLDTALANVRVYTQSSIRICGTGGTGTADGAAAPAPVIYFDPFRLADEPHDADYVLVTHAHYDHFSPEDLAKVAGPQTVVIAPKSMKGQVAGLGNAFAAAHFMQAGEKLQLPGITVEAVPAYNVEPERLHCHPRANGWLGYVVELDGVRYYAAGDTDQNPDNERVRCDAALVPIGGTYTMDPAQAAAFVNALKPQVAVPIHYGSIVGAMADADTFAAAVDPGIAVVRKLER